jgi:hypothetical protein
LLGAPLRDARRARQPPLPKSGVAGVKPAIYPIGMTQRPVHARITDALDRIEAALVREAEAGGDLRRRHDALKAEVAQAIAALDGVIGAGESR